jgi:gamma-glutamyltranspeptidase/glutathione hydrolase
MQKFISALALVSLVGCSHSNVASVTALDPNVREVKIAPREQVEAHGKKWMVSTQGKYATIEAAKVLEKGGNVIEAAIVASLVIGVERPQSTGVGGGGFWIYHEAKTGHNYVVDFRERAPYRAAPTMYLNAKGEVIEDLSVVGSLAVAVPGMIRGLRYIHTRWSRPGTDWRHLVAPAQALAERGFPVYSTLEHAIEDSKAELAQFPESRATYLHADGSGLRIGEPLVQKNLGKTLQVLANTPEDFYRGGIAKKILASIKKHGGIMNANDLTDYQVKERKPVEAEWNGYHVVSMPPPSSGGVHVIQMLKMLENDPLEKMGFLSADALQLEASAMQQAFADRARYLGDPDFVKVPTERLIANDYTAKLRSGFDLKKARNGADVFAGQVVPDDEQNTSHITIMDAEGNTVVSTQTINGYFGSSLVAEGTGIVLNNEMDDFAAKPGASNIFGATATTHANQVEPKKTPLSSMSPTIIFKGGKPILALGAPGGTRIITAVTQTILNNLVFHQDLYTSVASPRIHQQWQPDVLSVENREFPGNGVRDLSDRGWKIKRMPAQSNVMAVSREGDELIGVADPRDIGTSKGE